MKKLNLLVLLFLILFLPDIHCTISKKDSLYHSLDLALAKSDNYFQIRESKITGLKRMLNEFSTSDEQRFILNNDIFNEYAPYQCDSALKYLADNILLANKIGDNHKLTTTILDGVKFLSRIGMYKEAYDYLMAIDRNKLNDKQLEEFYYANYLIFNELGFSTRDMISKQTYQNNLNLYIDSLYLLVDSGSMRYLELKEKNYLDQDVYDSALIMNEARMRQASELSPEYGNIGFMRYLIYMMMENDEEKEIALLQTCIADTEGAKTDIAALNSLATILYNKGEIDKAYKYMQHVVECAKYYNGALRISQISEINSLINSAYFHKERKQKRILAFAVIGISILCVITIILIIYVIHQMKTLALTRNELKEANLRMSSLNTQLRQNNDKLKELNTLKEGYITLFLEMCSSYIDKLDDYNLKIHRKLVVGKYEEVLNMTNSKRTTGAERMEFYENFDKAFISLYPTFIVDFNELLRTEERIEIKRNEYLSTELRIFALIRLGITDSAQIASFLRCSVNTIYTYRTKMRNKAAVNRDDFESCIQRIGNISES